MSTCSLRPPSRHELEERQQQVHLVYRQTSSRSTCAFTCGDQRGCGCERVVVQWEFVKAPKLHQLTCFASPASFLVLLRCCIDVLMGTRHL